jgi:VWFA-related protein
MASASPTAQGEPITTFKAATRLVTIDVAPRDQKGNSLRDLQPDDFEVIEQIEPKRDKYPQKITAFQTTSVAELATLDPGKPKKAPGVYTNLVTMNRVPFPPTIILLDSLNRSSLADASSASIIKMLSSIPGEVPTAVFLSGRRLGMLQNFTTDPELLRATLEKIPSLLSNWAGLLANRSGCTVAANRAGACEFDAFGWCFRRDFPRNGRWELTATT